MEAGGGSYVFQDPLQNKHDYNLANNIAVHLGDNIEDQLKNNLQAAPVQPLALHTNTALEHATEPSESNSNLSKDEVAWYFVEQYYTTLSKEPEKLHLYYSKRSQFVCGKEAEITNVSIGRLDIQERIGQLDFSDCKVRVSNVDSQASFDNIVIQVIGEKCLKGAESRKFVQTFVLAPQLSGYFVLNDILRYIDDEDEQPAEPAAAARPVPAVKETHSLINRAEMPIDHPEVPEATVLQAPSVDPVASKPHLEEASASVHHDPQSVSDTAPTIKIEPEQVVEPVKTPDSTTTATLAPNTDAPVDVPAVSSPVKTPGSPIEQANVIAKEPTEEKVQEVEELKAPAPTPVVRPAPAPEPAKPMTWASRVAAAVGSTRSISVTSKTSAPPITPQSRAPISNSNPTLAPTLESTESPAPHLSQLSQSSAEWHTTGMRQQRQSSTSEAIPLDSNTLAYVKGVSDRVKVEVLRKVMEGYGEITYFDVSRPKQCAFVEYTLPIGLHNAKAASPIVVNGEKIDIEDRRPKANAYGGSNYTSRGIATRGRGSWDNGRDNSIRIGGLSNFRGGAYQPRGRGIVRGRGIGNGIGIGIGIGVGIGIGNSNGNAWAVRRPNDEDGE